MTDLPFAESLSRLGTESAVVVLARAGQLAAEGRDQPAFIFPTKFVGLTYPTLSIRFSGAASPEPGASRTPGTPKGLGL